MSQQYTNYEVPSEFLKLAKVKRDNEHYTVNYIEVESIIKEIKANKAPGYDGITPKKIKIFPENVLLLLIDIFNKCHNINYFPKCWRKATIILLPKAGKDDKDVRNYRPIILLSFLGKVFEKIIFNKLQVFVNSNKLIPVFQAGFRRGLSTTH